MATIVGELISKKPVELHPVHDQPGYYYVPQGTEFIVKKNGLPHERQSLVGGLSSKMSLRLSPKRDTSLVDGHVHEYYMIPNSTEFVLRRKHHGSVGNNEEIDFITRVRNHYCEPHLIKRCENDEETILVTINDFLVQEEDTIKINLTCDFNPENVLDDLTEIVDDIYSRYHHNNPICKTGISFNIKVSPTRLFVFSRDTKQVIPERIVKVDGIDIKPSASSLDSQRTRKNIKTIIAKQLKSKL